MDLGKSANAHLRPFFRRLGPEFSDFVPRGRALVATPVDWLLAGFNFDPVAHGNPSERWLSYFVDPLAAPKPYLSLGFSKRIPPFRSSTEPVFVRHEDARMVDRAIEVLLEIGLPALRPMLSLEGFYEFLYGPDRAWGLLSLSHLHEARASTAMLLHRFDEALAHLENGLAFYARCYDLDGLPGGIPDWQRLQISRFQVLYDHLNGGREDQAVAQLEEWRSYTVDALGIGDLMMRLPALD